MPLAVPSGCSRTRRPQNFLSPACPVAAAPAAGSAPAGVSGDTSPTGLPRPTMAASPRCRCIGVHALWRYRVTVSTGPQKAATAYCPMRRFHGVSGVLADRACTMSQIIVSELKSCSCGHTMP